MIRILRGLSDLRHGHLLIPVGLGGCVAGIDILGGDAAWLLESSLHQFDPMPSFIYLLECHCGR